MVKVQVTLVASPRNHLYRTGHYLTHSIDPFCFVSNAELDHFPDLADDLFGRLSGAAATKTSAPDRDPRRSYTIPLLDERHNCAAARAHDWPNSCCA